MVRYLNAAVAYVLSVSIGRGSVTPLRVIQTSLLHSKQASNTSSNHDNQQQQQQHNASSMAARMTMMSGSVLPNIKSGDVNNDNNGSI